jgi:nitrile hydratase
MDGPHDLGGKQGFGAVVYERNEPTFHESWEARVFGMVQGGALMAAGVVHSTDQFRHAIERSRPGAYLTHGYYGRWLGGLENLLVESGVLATADVSTRVSELGGKPNDLVAAQPSPTPDKIDYLPLDVNAARELKDPPRYVVGQTVRTHRYGVPGHTRLPAYARDRVGTIVSWHAGWVYPDSNAHGLGENPQHLYTVEFSGVELWGEDAEPGVCVNLDLFEPYLETADA